jgi:predicted HTH transcriptional regulator
MCQKGLGRKFVDKIDLYHFAPFPKNPTIAKFFIQLGRVDELGSGVLNVNRFTKEYAGSGSPIFIEGSTFKVSVPVGEGLNEGLNTLLEMIRKKPGMKAKDLSLELGNRPIKTIERQIKELITLDLIKRMGSRKTGGYHPVKN